MKGTRRGAAPGLETGLTGTSWRGRKARHFETTKGKHMSGRFDYVRYDDQSTATQAEFKVTFEAVAAKIETLGAGRPKSLALTKLEEAYMWVGKAIRDDQIARGGDAADVPERG